MTSIEESHDLSKLSTDILIGKLLTHELTIKQREEEKEEKEENRRGRKEGKDGRTRLSPPSPSPPSPSSLPLPYRPHAPPTPLPPKSFITLRKALTYSLPHPQPPPKSSPTPTHTHIPATRTAASTYCTPVLGRARDQERVGGTTKEKERKAEGVRVECRRLVCELWGRWAVV